MNFFEAMSWTMIGEGLVFWGVHFHLVGDSIFECWMITGVAAAMIILATLKALARIE